MPLASEIYLMNDWQLFMISKTVYFIYSAYYDNRDMLDEGPVVRFLVFSNSNSSDDKLICQLWFEGKNAPLESPIVEQEKLNTRSLNDEDDDDSHPFMMTCKAPSNKVPTYVSLVSKSCEQAHNLIYVSNNQPANGIVKDFLVVVRDLNDDEEDKSSQIVEWLEILKELGVSNVYFYVTKAHENVMKVLKFYEEVKFVTVKLMKYPEAIDSDKLHKNSFIALHDCLYQNLNLFHIIVPLDITELIIPKNEDDRTWRDLLVRTNDKRLSSSFFDIADAFPVQSVNFYVENENEDEIFYFLSNIHRSADSNPQGYNIKSFMSIQQVKTFNYQLPFNCLQASCVIHYVENVDGQLSHYVGKYDELSASELQKYYDEKEHLIKDQTLLKYMQNVVNSYRNTMKHVFKI